MERERRLKQRKEDERSRWRGKRSSALGEFYAALVAGVIRFWTTMALVQI
jgi:hypothetical protein